MDNLSGPVSLKAFSSEKEFEDYLRSEIDARNSRVAPLETFSGAPVALDAELTDRTMGPMGIGAAPAPSLDPGTPVATQEAGGADRGQVTPGFSQTTTQELGVDEADVVKTDGTYLYMIDATFGGESTFRIVRASPADQLGVESELRLPGFGNELYLHGDKIVALTATYGGFGPISTAGPMIVDFIDEASADVGLGGESVAGSSGADRAGDAVADAAILPIDSIPSEPIFRFERPKTIVTVIDVSDRTAPRVLSQTRFDGTLSSSRMIDGMLRLVVSNVQQFFLDVMPMLGSPAMNTAEVNGQLVLPTYQRTDVDGQVTSGEVLTWRELYRPSEPDGFGVVSLISLDVDNDARFTATGVVAEPGLIYSSTEALYLTNTNYDRRSELRTTTAIYKFRYEGDGAVPVAAGDVPGRVLNQYSMSEHKGFLRVATTVDRVFPMLLGNPGRESSNNVYVLENTQGSLDIVGRVEGLAPGETIQSARFLGDRGYLVTFKQIDPLFTLDLSDPTQPRFVGELKVPGFSTFLVPMDENRLLAVGRYIPLDGPQFGAGVQLSIFDVSDFSQPTLAHNVVLGENGFAWSQALSDPKAFVYFREEGLVALPVSIDAGRFFGGGISIAVEPEGFAEPSDLVREPMPGEEMPMGGTTAPMGGVDVPVSSPAPPDAVAIDEFVPASRFEGLVVFDVSADTGFTELGRISTQFDQGLYFGSTFTRGVFIDRDVFAVTNQGLRTVPIEALTTAPDSEVTPLELFYGRTDFPSSPDGFDGIEPFMMGEITFAGDGVIAEETATAVDGS